MPTVTRGPSTVNIGKAALGYAQRGLPILPLCWPDNHQCGCGHHHSGRAVGKAPLTPHGIKDATSDPKQVAAWWAENPEANIGLDLEKSFLLVVDCDSEEAVREAEALGLDSTAPVVLTGGGGRQFYFRAPEGITGRIVRRGTSRRIDVLASGYTVMPPSLHRSGRRYRWRSREDTRRFLSGDLSPAPDWAVQWLRENARRQLNGASDTPPENVATLAQKCLRTLPRTWRNRHAVIPAEDRSGWAYALARAAVEAGVTDPTEIAELIYTSAAHRDKFDHRPDGWKDALRVAERALQEEPDAAKATNHSWKALVRPLPDILSEQVDPPKWIVDGIIREGSLTLLAAKRKSGKSWLVQQIATAVATGEPIGGFIPATDGPVLYMALEGENLKERFAIQFGRTKIEFLDASKHKISIHSPDWDMLKRISCAQHWPKLDRGGIKQLEEYLQDNRETVLVIIDTFQAIRGRPKDSRQSLYELDYSALQPLRDIAHTYRVAIVAVHHLRKAEADDQLDAINASEGLAAAADNILILKRSVRTEDRATLYVTGRSAKEQKMALRFDRENCRWEILGPARDHADLTKEQQEIVRVLEQAGGQTLTAAEIHRRLPHVDYDAVRKRLKRMVDAGILTTLDGGGFYALRNPASTK